MRDAIELPVVLLERWCLRAEGGEFSAPEMRVPYVSGHVYGHPRFPEGSRISTSAIKAITRAEVRTSSGTVYRLGQPEPAFAAHLRSLLTSGQRTVLGVPIGQIIGDA